MKLSVKPRAPRSTVVRASTRAPRRRDRRAQRDARWEHEATHAARAVLAGGSGCALRLSSTAPASARVAGSPGVPLPAPLRRRLEHGFGADLGAVRIHTDAAAATAARDRRARGFAAGRDVYLDLPVGELAGERGLALLAHEVAHTLQQTARPGPDGRPRVTDISGSAPVQRAPDIADALKALEVFALTIDYADLKSVYTTTDPSDSVLTAEISKVEALLGGTDFSAVTSSGKAALAAETTTARFAALPLHVRGFYVDCLKALGQHEEAAKALDASQRKIATRFHSFDFYKHYRATRALAWLPAQIAGMASLKDFFPGNLLDAYRISLFSMKRDRGVHLQGEGKLLEAMIKLVNEIRTGKISGNDLDLAAAAALVQFDDARKHRERGLFDELVAEHKTKPSSATASFDFMAAFAGAFATATAEHLPAENGEQKALAEFFAPKLKVLAERARAYWSLVAQVRTVHFAETPGVTVEPIGDLTKIRALAQTLGSSAVVGDLDRVLGATIGEALAEPKQAPPAPRTIAASRTSADARLHAAALKLEAKLLKLARASKQTPEISEDGVRIGLALQVINRIQVQLGAYDAKADTAWRDKGQLDYWIADRIQLSETAADWGPRFGLTAVTAAATRFRSPERAQIAMLGTWTPSPAAPGDLATDLGSAEFWGFEGTGINVQELVIFDRAMFFKQLAEEIDALLATRTSDLTKQEKTILVEAHKKVEARPRLRRYTMDQVFWYLGEEAKTLAASGKPAAPILFLDLVLGHPRLGEIPGRGDAIFATSDDPGRHARFGENTVFVWLIPHMTAFVDELKRIETPDLPGRTLNDRVKEHWLAVHGSALAESIAPHDWLIALGRLTSDLQKAGAGDPAQKIAPDLAKRKQQEEIAKTVRARILSRQTVAHEAAKIAERKATTHTRLVEAQHTFRPQLGAFDRHDLSRFEKSREISTAFREFANQVRPSEDEPMQVATLVLELTPEIMRAFGYESGVLGTGTLKFYNAIVWLVPLVSGTLSEWNDPAFHSEIVDTSTYSEHALGQHADRLRGLLGELVVKPSGEREGTGLIGRIEAMRSGSKLVAKVTGADGAGQVSFPDSNATFKTGSDNYFIYGGQSWNLVAVHTNFVWYPAIQLEPLGIRWKQREAAGDSLLFGPDGKTPIAKNTKLLTLQLIDFATMSVVDRTITGTMDRDLEALSEAVVVNKIAEQLAALGETLESVANFIMEVMEFIPGIGQGVMALRFVMGVIEFLVSDDFQQLLALFKEDGIGAISKFLEKIGSVFEPEQLLIWLLFRAPKFPFTAPADRTPRSPKQRDIAAGKGGFSAVSRIVRNVLGFSGKLVKSVERVRARTQYPVRGLRLWVLGHPMASLLLDFIVDVALPAAEMTLDLLIQNAGETSSPDVVAMISEAAAAGITGILQGAADAVATLSLLELPEEIIPMDVVVDFIIDQVIRRVGAKIRVVLKVARSALQKLGVWNRITGAIAGAFKDFGGDKVNDFYRQEVRDTLQDHLDHVRAQMVNGLTSFFNDFRFGKELTAKPKAPTSDPITVDFHGDEFPESAPSPAVAPFPDLPRGPMPTPAGGERLPPALRAGSEIALGQDLGHVRIHRGADAERVTSTFRAEGVTTGSHVYLRPGLSPDGGHGGHVLRHELSHVIDQTGPRPLEGQHTDRPNIGAPGRGLVWDRASEARAESVARGGRPPPVGSSIAGLQPSLTGEFFTDFLKELRDPERIKQRASRLAGIQKTKADFQNDPKGKAVVDALQGKLMAAFDDSKRFTQVPPFDKVVKHILEYVKSAETTGAITRAIPHLVARARTTVTLKKRADREQREAFHVPPSALDVELSELLVGETGLGLQLKLNRVRDPEMDNRSVVDTMNPVKSIELIYLELPLASGPAAEKLWDLLVENTFTGAKGYSAGKRETFKIATKLVLGKTGHRVGFYEKASFKLRPKRMEVIVNQVREIEKIEKGGVWPAPEVYANPDVNAVTDAKLKDIGLRVGLYKDWDPDKHPVIDRDPHHVTQFLLVEYFRNVKRDFQPFPFYAKQGIRYPGVVGSGGEVDRIEGPQGAIDIATLYPARGGEMPTILLARPTHQSGLHYKSSKPDEDKEGKKRASQGFTVHRTYTAALKSSDATVASELSKEEAVKALGRAKDETKLPDGVAVRPFDVKKAIVAAARQTYQDLHDEMRPVLKRALQVQETRYYDLIASRLNPNSTLSATAIEPAYDKAIADNRDVVEKRGGFAKPG